MHIKSVLSILVTCVSFLTANGQTIVYTSGFENSTNHSEWKPDRLPLAKNPTTGRYIGKLDEKNEAGATLTLTNLPKHKYVTVMFDCLIGMSWDGNNDHESGYGNGTGDLIPNLPNVGPDIFKVTADKSTLVHTTFTTHDLKFYRWQSYPGTFPQDMFRAGTGAYKTNCLGASWNLAEFGYREKLPSDAIFLNDCIYKFILTYAHSTSTTEINFRSFNISSVSDEWWGIDNISVAVSDTPMSEVTRCVVEPKLRITTLDKYRILFHIWGEAGRPFDIESTTDFVVWEPEMVNLTLFGYRKIARPINNAQPSKFYRVIWK